MHFYTKCDKLNEKRKGTDMKKIKIISNPYNRSLTFWIYKEHADTWENIKHDDPNGRLCEFDEEKTFLPFNVKEIVDEIIKAYYVGPENIELIFEGTSDEYMEIENICGEEGVKDKIHLMRSTRILDNARYILDPAKETFDKVQPLIRSIIKDDPLITKGLDKVSDALKDIIPICIFGNYSAGKSTFINALIGYEILPSGGDPVTSKIYAIKRSDQNDWAKASFSYNGDEIELLFDDKECRVTKGDKDKDLIHVIMSEIEKQEKRDLFIMLNATIAALNYFEKRDKTATLISDVIRIEVPFSENGKLGQSHNEFVIFDTPGSNSNTNMDHKKVLTDSLEGFSNGIPVWVSCYDSIDSVDNAQLCEQLYQIAALDKRFTMIVVNKADSVELPKKGFGREEINNIMEYDSVEKMYSSGIYFVSSVMGLGAKNPDGMTSDYLLDVFDEKEKKFSDPSSRSYKKLYEYNIMPEQMKRRAMEYSSSCENRIYANSGLYCVEMEMEQFASRHAAYNKCQMVYMFLRSIIDETGKRIANKTEMLEKSKKKREQELDQKKYVLVESVKKETEDSIKQFYLESKAFIQEYIKELTIDEFSPEDLNNIAKEIAGQNKQDSNYAAYEQNFEEAKNSRWKNLVKNSQSLFKEDFVESMKNLAAEWTGDTKIMQLQKESMDSTRQNIDRQTSDKLLTIVIHAFKENFINAQNKFAEATKAYWKKNAQEYRDGVIRLITGSDALSEQQRAELSDVILSYQDFQYDDGADKVFIKAKFLHGHVLGIRIGGSERLDTSRLAASYNAKIKRNIEEMSELINSSCLGGFKTWQEKLQALVERNITIYNPELRELTEFIREESDRILELQTHQKTILDSFMTIENMMSWKELE